MWFKEIYLIEYYNNLLIKYGPSNSSVEFFGVIYSIYSPNS